MEKKYICYGGAIVSKNDGDIHRISAHRVARLYGLQTGQWINGDIDGATYGLRIENLTVLRPRFDGDYTLPEQ